MTVYYVHKDTQRDFTCDGTAGGLFDAWHRGGAKVLTESEFLSPDFKTNEDDIVVVHISFKQDACHEKLLTLKGKKVLQSFDESKSDGILFRTQLDFCRRHSIDTILNGFPSARNVEFLSSNGLSTITFPFCGLPRNVSYDKKDIDILVSGQIVDSYYPIRGKIFRALQESGMKFAHLPHSGMESSTARHDFHGKKFFDLLDRCWLGVTCRAGSFRDRLVPKYLEFGFSKVLPIGDCPTYMHHDMSSSMVAIDLTDDSLAVISKIKHALSNKEELIDRIEKYSARVHKDYNVDKNVERAISMLRLGKRDSKP